jgi:hypothetical protein
MLTCFLVAMAALIVGTIAPEAWAAKKKLAVSRVYFEFNSTANDLGVHVVLDGEDWRELEIVNPKGRVIFEVEGRGPYATLGMTELFFEGAEPNLDDVPLEELLAMFPEGTYKFLGETVEGDAIVGSGKLTYAIPAGPEVSASVGPGNALVISWSAVSSPPPGFPVRPIDIVAYQVIVGTFQVTVPDGTFSVTVSPEFVESLPNGPNPFEVLAIEAGGNQTITEGSFTKP